MTASVGTMELPLSAEPTEKITPVSGGLAGRARPLIRGLADMVAVADRGRERTEIYAPFNRECIGTMPSCAAEDVKIAVERARDAQKSWAARPLAERARVFMRYHDLVLDRLDPILDILQIEGGKSRQHALEETLDVAINARYYAAHAAALLKPKRRQTLVPLLVKAWELNHPFGVVGIIAPWNYPFTMAVSDAIPALIAGNAVVLKPADLTPFSALYAVRLLYEAGLPGDLFQVVTGRGSVLGTPLIDQSDFIGFTGSTEVGRKIGEQAGRRLIKASLELGGKNPLVILDDADLERATYVATHGSYAGAGQLCISFERIYVQSGIYDRFVEAFIARTKGLRLGPALDFSVDVGSLIGANQLEKTLEHLDDARSKGAQVLAGGRSRPDIGPYFFEPTILTGVTEGMQVYREETFGPVVSVYKVDSVEEAIERANDTEYGLNAGVICRDEGKAVKVASQIRAGTVGINETYMVAWSSMGAPMGGMKDSGMGRRHGVEGILKYTESQNISLSRISPLFPFPGMSVEASAKGFVWMLRAVKHIPGLR
jgi:succinate-semialdehyde dehydrogenase / glutarate-semialdehyde dehydrogenase